MVSLYTISHKKYPIADLHYGDAIGCDFLKSLNIDVIGTPYKVDFIYKLFAFTMGFRG